MTLTFCLEVVSIVMSTIALYSTLNISETVRDRGLFPKDLAYGLSNGYVTDDEYDTSPWKVKLVSLDPNTLRAQYLENRCYLATIADY